MKPIIAKVMMLATVILMDILSGVEFDLFVPSFPELQKQFGLSPFWVEALLSVNFVGYCLGLLFVGSLADCYGRKPVILMGLLTFVIGSALCLGGDSYLMILTGRFFQGIGVAAPAILSFLLIADAYSLKKQQAVLAMLMAVSNISIAVAPVVGSYVTLHFHWQGNFMTLFFLGVISLAMAALFVPNHKLPEPKKISLLRGYLAVFQSKPLMLLIVNIIFIIVPYWVVVGISPLLYLDELGVSLAHFGYYQGTLAFVFAIGCVIYGCVIEKYDQKKMLWLSNGLFVLGVISVGVVTFLDGRYPLLITLALLPFIIGQIIPGTLLYPASLHFIPEAKGRVTAIIHGGRLMLSAVGLQLVGYFYAGSFQNVGIILLIFMIGAVITLFCVLRHATLMRFDKTD